MNRFIPETMSATDRAVDGVKKIIQALVALTGGDLDSQPVLELQIGDVLTRTALQADHACRFLIVTAFLPVVRQSNLPSRLLSNAATSISRGQKYEYLWDGDEGRFACVCSIPVESLTDDRSVLDAVLKTCDQFNAWYAMISDVDVSQA